MDDSEDDCVTTEGMDSDEGVGDCDRADDIEAVGRDVARDRASLQASGQRKKPRK